eukprot:13381528-Alexandrium_andersonii.AAC.1
MSASLVGSEMCIRDRNMRHTPLTPKRPGKGDKCDGSAQIDGERQRGSMWVEERCGPSPPLPAS